MKFLRMHKLYAAASQLLLLCLALPLISPPALAQDQAGQQQQQQQQPAEVEGTYDGEIIAEGQGTLTFTLIVKRDGNKLTTEVKDGGELNITGIALDGEKVTLSATWQGNPFELPGTLAATGMGGKWEAGPYAGTWTAKRRAATKA